MKGKNPSAEQKRYHDLLASRIGCIACYKEFGERNHHISVHHVDGRTKPNAHFYVLTLCASHHQDGTGAEDVIAVHPWKARFEQRYGTQRELMIECVRQLQEMGERVPATVEILFGLRDAQ